MKKVKKIEVIIGAIEFKRILNIFNHHNLNYTAITNVSGLGSTGPRYGDESFGVFKNSYLISALEETEWTSVKEELQHIIKLYNGICIVTDAEIFQ